MKSFTNLPDYLQKTNYTNPNDQDNGPFQYANNLKDQSIFAYMGTQPKLLNSFQTFFEADRGSRPNWVDWFPVKEKLLDDPIKPAVGEDEILYVDIAGGRGHELLAFKEKFPEYKGRYVLHDLPVITEDQTLQLGKSVEKRAINFFEDKVIPGT